MRTVADVAVGPDFTIRTVTCHDDHTRWSQPESREEYNLVLARRGRFRRRVDGVCADIDATLAYVGVPGAEEHFAHPAGGDICTWINLRPPLWFKLAGDTLLARSTFYVDAQLDLIHRRMLTAARTGDLGYALAQQLLEALSDILKQVNAGPTPADVPIHDTDRAAVAAAREAILTDHPAAHALLPLAALLAVSPFRLSRAFSREMGVSVTYYRNRVRVTRALDRLEHGEDSLAVLAADLGFADQAHLCRTVRRHLDHTPTALRRLLRSSN
ncbi:helix-turn-helix transcriptional regulator [Actinomadura sp. HBU206391]|uniref:helix-turn-helix transcriptional regulator n=1 Tax=Actinomadura sp. HBU206391 TaxID=2731692 RepID=UPI00164F5EBE|nr:helix-turn-helix transcriptional regulator [Actinomadura sp. HBU206391]MBC6462925.1 helix-turn-helix transcriptional regulator [Actinomadura sp. HBU206391]